MKTLLGISFLVVCCFCSLLLRELNKLAEHTIEQDQRINALQQDNHEKAKRLIYYDSTYGKYVNR